MFLERRARDKGLKKEENYPHSRYCEKRWRK